MFEEGKKENQGKLVSVIFSTQINVSKTKTSHLLYKFLKIVFANSTKIGYNYLNCHTAFIGAKSMIS